MPQLDEMWPSSFGMAAFRRFTALPCCKSGEAVTQSSREAVSLLEDVMKTMKLLMVPFAFAATIVALPSAAAADPTTNCFLMAGCAWDSSSQTWLCPDPLTYQDCVIFAG